MYQLELKKLRVSNELSQEALAYKAGVSVGFLSKLELGKINNVSINTLKKIAKALGTNLEIKFRNHKAA